MNTTPLGRSDLLVSRVSMGCWNIVGDATWGPQDEAVAIAAFRAALDEGINFFDTAEMYGDGYSEQLLGRALGADRSRVMVATKAGSQNLAPESLRQACERSLQNLGTDTIDLYQIHWPSREVPLEASLETLRQLRSEGKIRYFGVSNFGPKDLAALFELADDCISNQFVYSLLARAVEYEVLPACREHGLSVLPYSPLAQGLLTGKFASADEVPAGRARTRHFSKERPGTRHGEPGCEAETFAAVREVVEVARELGCQPGQLALAWLLHQEGVPTVLAGARSPAQVRENAAAAEIRLDSATLQRLAVATDPVKQALGRNLDMWVGQENSRIA